MCGIAGLLHPDAESRRFVIERMLAEIRHRGPDDEGVWLGQGCALGHARLAIIDLSQRGHQPMSNEDGTVWVVLNGEIYNYRELRDLLAGRGHRLRSDSDTEVLPHLYEEYGPDFVRHLHGMFAIGLWDSRARRLILARDRAGKKPLYVAAVPHGFAFASEMKALFAVPGVDTAIRPQGIHDYLSFGAIPGAATIYSGIRRVPPAHVLTIDADGDSVEAPYWSLAFHPKQHSTREEAVDEIEARLRRAVRLRLRSDVPVGCFLSGGIDSGLVVAMAAQESSSKLRTYSVGFEDDAFDERDLARVVSRRFGTEHVEFVVTPPTSDEIPAVVAHFDEPYSDPSMLPSFAVARRAAEDIKVVLNGDGADEVFAGYRHVLAARILSGLDRTARFGLGRAAEGAIGFLPPPAHGRSRYQFLHRTLRALVADPRERFLALTGDRLSEMEKAALYGPARAGAAPLAPSWRLIEGSLAGFASLGPVDRTLGLDFHLLLGAEHLVKMDMASMAFALEARSPFLDHALIEFAASLPERLKLPGRTTKPLLRALAARLLPPEVARAPKRGFEIPLQRWMQRDLNPLLRGRVLHPGSFALTHFDSWAVRSLIDGRGWDAKRWAGVAWMLLCLEFWWDNYRQRLLPIAAAARRSDSPVRVAV